MRIRILPKGAAWYEFAPGVRVKVAPLTRRRIRELVTAHPDDPEGFARAMADEAVLEWEGLVDETGAPLEPTPENKAAVIDNPLIGPWLEPLARGAVSVPEDEEKN